MRNLREEYVEADKMRPLPDGKEWCAKAIVCDEAGRRFTLHEHWGHTRQEAEQKAAAELESYRRGESEAPDQGL